MKLAKYTALALADVLEQRLAVNSGKFVPRHSRQAEEGEVWVANAVAYMFEIGLFDSLERIEAIQLAEALLYNNKDEGGEIMDWNVKAVIDEELTYWGD